MKILLAVDGSAYTKKMLAYLASHDEMLGSTNEYALINVQPPLPLRVRSAVGASTVNAYYAEESAKVTDSAVKFLQRHGVEPKLIRKVGPAGEVIAKTAASDKFDLLIMGSHGHGALGNLLLGSVATKALANCKVPVLLVR